MSYQNSNPRRLSAILIALTVLIFPSALLAKKMPKATPEKKTEAATQAPVMRQFSEQANLSDGSTLELTIVAISSSSHDVLNTISSAISRVSSLHNSLFGVGGLQEQINKLPKKTPLALPKDAFDLVSKAVMLSGQTGGWFDVSASSQRSTFASNDWRKISLDPATSSISFKTSGMNIDLTKIAVGFLIDIAMEEIQKAGFTDAKVSLGSVQRTIGQDIYTPWTVTIPYGGEASDLASRSITYKVHSIATATVHPLELGKGFRDGLSGKEVTNSGFKTVTVFAKDAAEAVAYGLSVYANKQKMGMKYVMKHPEIKAIVVYDSGYISTSPDIQLSSKGFEDRWPKGQADGGPDDLRQKQTEEENDK